MSHSAARAGLPVPRAFARPWSFVISRCDYLLFRYNLRYRRYRSLNRLREWGGRYE